MPQGGEATPEESEADKTTGEAADAASATPPAATVTGPTTPAQPSDKSTNTAVASTPAAQPQEGQVIRIAVVNPSRVRSVYDEEAETDDDSEFDKVSDPESQYKTAKSTVSCLRKWPRKDPPHS